MRTLLMLILLAVWGGAANAQTAPRWTPVEGDYVGGPLAIESGGSLPELRMHYRTLGTPVRNAAGHVTNAVMILHGTGGTGATFLSPLVRGRAVRTGPAAGRDAVLHHHARQPGPRGSTKPSDGLRAAFPAYQYADMVEAQRRMLVEGLHVDHLRLILGTSMGCMHAFVWGETHRDFADALMPLACEPTALVGRNRLWRTMLKDAIRNDPAWMGGNYVEQPKLGLREAVDLLVLAGGATMPLQHDLATPAAVDAWAANQQARRLPGLDANDLWYQVNASSDYDPSADLEKITAPVMWINSADDFINPPELGLSEQFAPRIRNGQYRLIPNSVGGHGHGTHTWATFWKADLVALLARSGG
jgi:homoserine O-acetyltransferase